MAPAASEEEEEQGKGEVEKTAPAAPEQPPQVVDSNVYERTKKIEDALSSVRSCHARCFDEMLVLATRRRRFLGDDLELRCLDFLENELSYIVVCLTALAPDHVDEEMMAWLQRLIRTASETRCRDLDEASKGFRRQHRYQHWLRSETTQIHRLAGYPSSYMHLLEAEGGGHLPVDVHWFERSQPPSYDEYEFPYEIQNLTIYMVSMFPHGYKFQRDQLLMKWLCDAGLLNYSSSILTQATAEQFFCNLVNLNLITRAEANSRHNNPDEAEAWRWNVNHLQHQFLASKAAKMGFLFTSDTLNGNETAGRIARRLALHQDDPNIPSLLQKIDVSKTRSLAVSGTVSGVSADKFVDLVVLDVEGWENFGDEDLLRVCRSKMFFLEYLSIRNTRVSKLPPEIKELCGLKILDAGYTQVTELPLGVFVATRLQRLDIRGTPIRQVTLPKQTSGLQNSLVELLLGGGDGMISSVEATATGVPHEIRRFSILHTLATIDLSEQPASFVKALGDLCLLRVLAITWSFHQSSDRDYCEALLSSIKRWCDLESLTIHCGLGCSMEFLGSLSNMSAPLNTFNVTVGKFAGVPKWFDGHMYLSFVQITVCKLGDRDLEILRGLPWLKCLIMGLDFIPKEAIVIKNGGFSKLRRFSIDCQVPWLTFESGAMSNLTYLQLNLFACPTNPISVPLGISNLFSLAEVALWYNVRYTNRSSVKMTVEAVRKEVAKRRKTTQIIALFINGIEQDVQVVDEETLNTTRVPSETNAGDEDAVQAVDEITEA
ncbi:hypothetical protein SEVIR_8G193400v4 [Setaria viridis]|uniref:Disease resistance R13L4/SHOC-2-like LRR domain-containing protein n=1 Tax=Setaria viridis TaxID=4556 RepID=A0A4U6TIW1_SETVI|nr:disease resistance protein Pikm1-TS-like [Setaria viridis]XP_034606463.1 disease resistance protein Pikm1-TS-like [Setaria viridis]TKW01632.1 hypothetical protein SEVIR_8G193400v2 [Setaria viridis]